MEKIWIDANVILRYLLCDHQEFFQKAQKIMLEAEQGKVNYHPPLEVEASCFIDQTCYWGYIPQQ